MAVKKHGNLSALSQKVPARRIIIVALIVWVLFLLYSHTVVLGTGQRISDSTNDFVRGVSKQVAETLCKSSPKREACMYCVMATNSLSVAKRFAKLILADDKKKAEDLDEENGVTIHDAQVACALAIDKVPCIHDVMGTGDIDTADMYEKHAPEVVQKDISKLKMTDEQAENACKLIHPDDKDFCKKHVMSVNDEDTANHFVHLFQDQKHLNEKDSIMTDQEREALCAQVQTDKKRCMQDVIVLKHKHIAEHYIELLQNAHDTTSLVSQRDAEKLCNLLPRKHRPDCTKSLIKMNAKDAALHYSTLHKAELLTKPRLSDAEAEAVCAAIPDALKKKECRMDVKTMNDLEVASRYVQLMMQQ